ncbi:MAG: glycoside hydrolase family 2 TIM barrel-domain containing protein, partial [Candidatus Methylacidiphilales bacterium]
DDFSRAEISMDICIERDKKADRENCGGAELHWQILDETGTAVLDQKLAMEQHDLLPRLKGTVQNPRLWWPHDQGEQPLYLNRIELRSESGELLDVHEQRIGFRRVRLVMHEGAWDSPEAFPKSRSNPPITLEINGRTIFCKGANWVSPEIFPGLLARETYATQLGMTRAANMNLLRMWGGAPVQKASFYELCDELGIMVWQEFPLACNFYAGTREYLRVLQNESEAIVMKLKPHPSLVIWCGGNELFNAWSGMTDQSHALRLLNSVCFELDPERPFLMTSPVDGVGHGHYVFRDPESGQEAWEVFQKAACTAYCEFGCPGPASREVLESIIPSAELWPPKVGTAWETHHAFGVWMQSSHLYVDVLEHYFGPSDNLDVMIERGQLLQCEGYKGLYEEARRQKPKSSMALCWCLNEPWPSAANNSLISWPSKPKPALAAVGQACRPVMASARIRKFQWREGEVFDPELWLLSDSAEVRPRRQVEVWLEHAGTSTLLLTWNVPAAEANTNTQGPRVQYALPMPSARGNSAAAGSSDVAAADIKRFDLVLRAKDASGFAMHEQDSRYTLLFVPGRKQRRNPRSMN